MILNIVLLLVKSFRRMGKHFRQKFYRQWCRPMFPDSPSMQPQCTCRNALATRTCGKGRLLFCHTSHTSGETLFDSPFAVDESSLTVRIELGLILRCNPDAVPGEDTDGEAEDQDFKNEHSASSGRNVSAQVRAMSILTRLSSGMVSTR